MKSSLFFNYTVIAGVNLNNLKANHNLTINSLVFCLTVIAGVNLNNLKANHNLDGIIRPHELDCYRWRKFK